MQCSQEGQGKEQKNGLPRVSIRGGPFSSSGGTGKADEAVLFGEAGLHGAEGGVEIDGVGDFPDDLFVGDDAVGADDEHGAAEETEFLDRNAVGRAEGQVAVVGQGFHGVHAGQRVCAKGRSQLMVRIRTLSESLVASVLKRRVCMSQTGVSREGTTLRISTLPL